ncbi:formin-binding protein 4-like isoform X2 [Ostrea edulis]|nr:formin-binding protein 4-like isoform X2 [Ostrea edulis]
MGRTRGSRRHVLQLNDNKESYLAKYGYSRQEGNGNEDDNSGSDMETDQDNEGVPEASSSSKNPPDTPDIDDKVANFLAEIQSIDPETEDDPDARPSFQNGGGIAIPPPTFSLNSSQSLPEKIQEPDRSVPKKSGNAYKSMFVKGESEFVRPSGEKEVVKSVPGDIEWPEEPSTVWQQTLDENTQYHYYWNTVTNEVTWEIPTDYTRYLLLYKEYEEKVAKLKKEGKVKPPPKTVAKVPEGPVLPVPKPLITESSSPTTTATALTDNHTSGESVSSTSEVVPEMNEAQTSGILKNKQESPAPVLPDSTNTKTKTPQLVAYHGGSSAESSTDSSEDSDSDEDSKKTSKRNKNQDTDDLDIDDIDKALEMALEKKKSHKEHKSKRRSSDSKSDGKASLPKSRSLVDAMREQVQQKQEIEARRKAAIEEMMARELERRVGPPRKRPTPEDPSLHGDWDSKKTKVLEYEHGRRSRRDERESQGRSSTDKDYDRDSRHKRDDHKKHKKDDRDRDRKREEKKRDEHRKKDKQDDKRKDEKKRHKDKDREKDDKKKDKKKDKQDKQKNEEKEEKTAPEKKSKESKQEGSEEKPEEKIEVKKVPEAAVKKEPVTPPPPSGVKKAEPSPPIVKAEVLHSGESHLTPVQLANLKMQASELVELALSKLEFLEVTKKGLSKLQILLVELETRQQDWQSGGLTTEYFLLKLEEANRQLQQYEQSAAPPGWTCHWDRAYRRYFYMNKKTNRTQWDYPEEEEEEEEEEEPDDVAGKERQHSMSSSPQRDLEEDANRMFDVGNRIEEVASSSTIDTEIKSKSLNSQKSEKSHRVMENSLDSTDSHKFTLDNSDSMDIEDQPKEPPETSQAIDGEPVSSTVQPTETGAPDTTAILSVMDEIFQGKSKYRNSTPVSTMDVTQVSQSYDYSNSIAAASVMQGEPPPPGTDLDLLLAAPPPPPPPADEASDVPMETYDTSVPITYSSIDGDPMVHSSVADSIYPSEAGVISAESSYTPERKDAQPVVAQELVVIARPPHVFSRDEPGVPEVVSGTEFVQESVSGEVTLATAELPSSSGISSEKKKKRKDKSMSSSGLHLKKKNVSSLVQKWQKVKKEVEIEERHREEREQAIRQKLEEWKQEYN